MKLCVRSMALAAGLLWGGAMLLVGVVAAASGVHDGGYYGSDFLLVMASIYPGYEGTPSFGDAFVGSLYGLVDGAIAGALLACLYNRLAPSAAKGAEGSAA